MITSSVIQSGDGSQLFDCLKVSFSGENFSQQTDSLHSTFFDKIKPFIKDSSKEKVNLLSLKIDDFIQEKIEQVSELVWQYHKESIYHESYRLTDQNFKLTSPDLSISKLNLVKKNEFESTVIKHACKVANLRLKAFKEGKTFFEICSLTRPFKGFYAQIEDFINCPPKARSTTDPHEINRALLKNRLKNKITTTTSLVGLTSLNAILSSYDLAYAHLLQIKSLIQISSDSGRLIEQISSEELVSHLKAQDHSIEERQKKADSAFRALLEEEEEEKEKRKKTVKKFKRKSGVVKQTTKINAKKPPDVVLAPQPSIEILNPLVEKIEKLNEASFLSFYFLHPRIKRWNVRDVYKIQLFKDFDFTTNQWVQPYAAYQDPTQLKFLQNQHNLVGIERFLSDPYLCETYTFTYEYQDQKVGDIKKGRGIYCKMVTEETQMMGIIHVGIGQNNLIFHAMFDPLKDKAILPGQIAKRLEFFDQNLEEDDGWELTTDFIFSPEEEKIVKMQVGKTLGNRVEYYFFPIKD